MKNKKAQSNTIKLAILTVVTIFVILAISGSKIWESGKNSAELFNSGETCFETGRTAKEYNDLLSQNIYLELKEDTLEKYSEYKSCFSISENIELGTDEEMVKLAWWLCEDGSFSDSTLIYDILPGENQDMELQCLGLNEIKIDIQNNNYASAKEKADLFTLFSTDPITWHLLIAEANLLAGDYPGSYGHYKNIHNNLNQEDLEIKNEVEYQMRTIYKTILTQKIFELTFESTDLLCFTTDNFVNGITFSEINNLLTGMGIQEEITLLRPDLHFKTNEKYSCQIKNQQLNCYSEDETKIGCSEYPQIIQLI